MSELEEDIKDATDQIKIKEKGVSQVLLINIKPDRLTLPSPLCTSSGSENEGLPNHPREHSSDSILLSESADKQGSQIVNPLPSIPLSTLPLDKDEDSRPLFNRTSIASESGQASGKTTN